MLLLAISSVLSSAQVCPGISKVPPVKSDDETRCSDDASCSFNGVCRSSTCACEAGWKGVACEQLELENAEGTGTSFTGATAGLNLLNAKGNFVSVHRHSFLCLLLWQTARSSAIHRKVPPRLQTSTWGGSVVKGRDGQFHMFAAMMVGHCGINAWLQNSVVLHAVSSTATGVYTPRQIVAPVFSHEPIAATAPTGAASPWRWCRSPGSPSGVRSDRSSMASHARGSEMTETPLPR